jgi:hypothetical protein
MNCKKRHIALSALGLAALLALADWLTSTARVGPGIDAADPAKKPKLTERLQKAIPSWARDAVVGLLKAKSAEAAPADSDQELCALDAEVDLLAGALLALEQPAAVLVLYEEWYGEQPARTPAAPLLQAKAHRMKAWHYFDPPPGRPTEPVRDRLGLFTEANKDLAKGINVLIGATGEIYPGASGNATSPENLAHWLVAGLPKPRKRAAELPLRREPMSVFHGVDYLREYLGLRAVMYRELGDLIYREQSSPFAPTAVKGTGIQYPTALAWYAEARKPLYLARLLDHNNIELRREARTLEERTHWIRAGLAFGGIDFFEFEPYSNQTYITPALKDLKARIGDLTQVQGNRKNRTARQEGWLASLKEHKLTRAALITSARKSLTEPRDQGMTE